MIEWESVKNKKKVISNFEKKKLQEKTFMKKINKEYEIKLKPIFM